MTNLLEKQSSARLSRPENMFSFDNNRHLELARELQKERDENKKVVRSSYADRKINRDLSIV